MLAASQPGPRPACDGVREQAADAMREASRRWPPARACPDVGAQFFEVGKRLRVSIRIAAQADRKIVAAVLALDADAARQPPDRRMIEEQRLDERLQQVHQVVVAADVRELVREDRFELLRRQPCEGAAGNSTTGRSHPMTVGTSTSADWSRRIGREMWSRRASRATVCVPHVGGR